MFENPNDPRHNTPESCQTMADVRYEVDRIDRLLVSILTERQGLMNAAARIKHDRAAVRDPARVEDVVSKVLASARATGLDPAIAEPVWRTLIEQCIQHEFRRWDEHRQTDSGAPKHIGDPIGDHTG